MLSKRVCSRSRYVPQMCVNYTLLVLWIFMFHGLGTMYYYLYIFHPRIINTRFGTSYILVNSAHEFYNVRNSKMLIADCFVGFTAFIFCVVPLPQTRCVQTTEISSHSTNETTDTSGGTDSKYVLE